MQPHLSHPDPELLDLRPCPFSSCQGALFNVHERRCPLCEVEIRYMPSIRREFQHLIDDVNPAPNGSAAPPAPTRHPPPFPPPPPFPSSSTSTLSSGATTRSFQSATPLSASGYPRSLDFAEEALLPQTAAMHRGQVSTFRIPEKRRSGGQNHLYGTMPVVQSPTLLNQANDRRTHRHRPTNAGLFLSGPTSHGLNHLHHRRRKVFNFGDSGFFPKMTRDNLSTHLTPFEPPPANGN
jgi:hypothetical protein